MLRFFEENNISIQLSDITIVTRSFSPKNENIELFEHILLGKILVINNEIQHIEAWAPFYHESLVHIPASFITDIKSVLILGGGSFYAAKEILKYSSVEKIVMVDHDEEVIRIAQKYYPHVQPIIDNPKFQLVINDVYRFLKSNKDKFDLIINDALDLLENGSKLFSELSSFLSPQGVCSDVVYRHLFERERTQKTVIELRKSHNAAFSLVTIPEYPGFFHILAIWSKAPFVIQEAKKPRNRIQIKWRESKKNPCLYYHPGFTSYYLYLPPYLKKWVTIL